MSYARIGDRYARAIFELGVESGELAALTEQIRNLAEVYAASPDLRSVLENPLVASEQRDQILSQIANRLGLGKLAQNSMRYLASRRRLHALPDVARRLAGLSDEKEGVVRASVTSATPLPEAFYQRLILELEAMTAKKIALERLQDPSLIGGVVTKIGDNTIDGSVRGRLEHLERQLKTA
jgi:F-type H+-transporting ATPase subunit delta